jgi:hypothetical protein
MYLECQTCLSGCPCRFGLRTTRSFRPPAFGAKSNYPKEMLLHFKLVFCGHRILYGLEFGRKEFDDLAALGTDHMIVMLVFVVMLVMSSTISKTHFSRQPSVRQEFQGAIDGGLAHSRIFLLDEAIEVFTGKVFFDPQKDV